MFNNLIICQLWREGNFTHLLCKIIWWTLLISGLFKKPKYTALMAFMRKCTTSFSLGQIKKSYFSCTSAQHTCIWMWSYALYKMHVRHCYNMGSCGFVSQDTFREGSTGRLISISRKCLGTCCARIGIEVDSFFLFERWVKISILALVEF